MCLLMIRDISIVDKEKYPLAIFVILYQMTHCINNCFYLNMFMFKVLKKATCILRLICLSDLLWSGINLDRTEKESIPVKKRENEQKTKFKPVVYKPVISMLGRPSFRLQTLVFYT